MNYLSYLRGSVLLLLLVGWTNCQGPAPEFDAEVGISPAPLTFRGGTISLAPSGDTGGTTDAANLEDALNTPGVKNVKLAAGTYYLNRTIRVFGFAGRFTGQGTENTRIVGVGSNAIPFGEAPVYEPLVPDLIQSTAFFFFIDPVGSISISNLELSLPEGFIARTSIQNFTDNLTTFIGVKLGTSVADVELKNVHLFGTTAAPGSPDWYNYQPNYGATILGDRDASDFPVPSYAGGKIKVQQCQIAKTSIQALLVEVLKKAKITLSGNSFFDTKQVNLRFLDGCSVRVTDNDFITESFGSLVITQELALGFEPINGDDNDVKVLNNDFVSDGYLAVEIGAVPDPAAASFLVQIEGNTITMGPNPFPAPLSTLAGIGLFEGTATAVIRDNVIAGGAEYAIYCNTIASSEILQNATTDFTAGCADYGLLGPSDGNIISSAVAATAVDEGSGNSFSGPFTLIPPCE